MKKKNVFTILALAALFCGGLSSCSDDENAGQVMAIGIKEAVYVSAGTPSMQLSLKDNATLQLTPFIMPQNAKNPTVSYATKRTDIIEMSQSGLITPKTVGVDTLTVSATDGSGVSASFVVNVLDHMIKATAINVTAAGKTMSIKVNTTFDLGACVSLSPADTWDKSVTYATSNANIATVDASGIVSAIAEGSCTITVRTADGSNLSTECSAEVLGLVIRYVDYNRTGWTATAAPATAMVTAADASVGCTEPMYLLDDAFYSYTTATPPVGRESCFGMYKPGREGTPMENFPDDQVYFIIDMKAQQEIGYLRLRHRSDNRTVALQVWKASFYGSNDGVNFAPIITGVVTKSGLGDNSETALPANDPGLNVQIELDQAVSYRYVKMIYDEWNTTASGQMQISEFNIGKIVIE